MSVINNLIDQSVVYLSPVLLCVLGGIFAYKANMLNIALEGMMMAGAFVSLLIANVTGSVPMGYLSAIVVCLLLGLVFSLMGVVLRGNVIVIGLAINMLVPAVAGFIMKIMSVPSITLPEFSTSSIVLHIPFIENIPILGPVLSGHPPITYISYIMIPLMSILMYRTRFGVHVRVVGESEDTAISLGLKTNMYKVAAILIGAGCCALAGINLALERLSLYTNNMTAGRGFIAIAAIYCGRGKPLASSMYAVLFSIANALAEYYSLRVSASLLLKVVPYVVMVAVLSIASILNRHKVHVRGAFSEQ